MAWQFQGVVNVGELHSPARMRILFKLCCCSSHGNPCMAHAEWSCRSAVAWLPSPRMHPKPPCAAGPSPAMHSHLCACGRRTPPTTRAGVQILLLLLSGWGAVAAGVVEPRAFGPQVNVLILRVAFPALNIYLLGIKLDLLDADTWR